MTPASSPTIYDAVLRTKQLNLQMELPADLLSDEILCRLPVKHLLRCRCVSKGWCSLIDSNEFVKKHLKRMIVCDTRGIIINGPYGEFHLADFDSLDDDSASFTELEFPLNTFNSGAYILGSANGLVCVEYGELDELFLSNPSTRKTRKIPSAPSKFLNSSDVFNCGFGYDYVNDDYKVLMITHDNLSGMIAIILYSMKSNRWTWIENVPGKVACIRTTCGICASGSLYFLAEKNDSSDIIIGFDFGLQQFEEVPIPAINWTPADFAIRCLMPFEGSLSIIIDCIQNYCVDVWVLNHSRTDKHWSKAYSLPRDIGVLDWFVHVAFSKSRKDVLLEMNNRRLAWYNIERKTFQNVKILGIPFYFDSCLFTESLLQLTEENLLQKPSQDKQKKRDDFLLQDLC